MKIRKLIVLLILAGAFVSLFLMLNARADSYYYKNILVGERGAGMGGAFSAIADDPSGMYYNPGGLVLGQDNYYSLSVNAYQTGTESYEDVFNSSDYTYRSGVFVPSMFGFAQAIGSSGKDKFGFGVFVVNNQVVDQDDEILEITATNNRSYSINRQLASENSVYWIGPAYSREITPKLSVGLSLFAVLYHEKTIDMQYQRLNPVGTGRYTINNTYIYRNAYGILPKLGAIWSPIAKWSFGLTASKNFNVGSSGRYKVLGTNLVDAQGNLVTVDGSQATDITFTGSNSLATRILSPWEFTAGVAYFPSSAFLISADTTLYIKDTTYRSSPNQTMFNWALGAEAYVTERLPIRLGVFSNNSNVPSLVAGAKDQHPKVNMLGISTGVSLVSATSSLTFTGAYTFGSGEGQVVGDTTDTQPVSKNSFSLYIAGSYQM